MPMKVRQLHPLFTGEVNGLDLREPLDKAIVEEIATAMDRYAVLVFRGEKLSEEQQVAFSARFGPIAAQNGVLQTGIKRRVSEKLVDISNLDENNRVLGADDRRRMFALGNQLWHTDSSFKRIPAKYSLLHAHAVTPEGGETQFADMRAAYDALSDNMKRRIEGLLAEHSIFHSRSKLGFTEFTAEERAALPPAQHPVVRIHPGSRRKTLYLASHASHVIGLPIPDGRMLIGELIEHATQPSFVYTHRWEVGDLVMWDNRCTMHRGRPYDEATHRRDLRRATVDNVEAADEVRVA